MTPNIQERHLIDRYLQGDLSGIELDDFKNRLTADHVFKQEVELLKIIYAGINRAREQQLEKKILSAIPPRQRSLPLALKLILIFLIITVSFVSLWFYAGKEYSGDQNQKTWISFLNQSLKIGKKENKTTSAKTNASKSLADQKKSEEAIVADTLNEQNTSNDLSAENNKETISDSLATNNSEDGEVKQDQLLISTSVSVNEVANEKQKEENSLTADASHKMSGSDLPEPDGKTMKYDVEYWVSPVNYRGYKMSKNKIVLFGIEEPDAVKLYRVSDDLYMSYFKDFYRLNNAMEFAPFVKVKEIPKILTEKGN